VKCLKNMASFKVTLLFILSVVWTVLADEAADPEPEEFLTVEVGTDGEQTVYPVGDTGFDIMEMEIAFKKKFLDDELEAVYKRYGEIVYKLLDEQKTPDSISPDGQAPMLKANGWNTMTQKIVEEQRFARTRIAGIEMEARIIEEEFGPIESIQQMADRHGDLEYDIVETEAFFVKKFLNEEWDVLYKRYGEIKKELKALEEEQTVDFIPPFELDPKTQVHEWRERTQTLMEQQRFARTRLANIETELQALAMQYSPIRFIKQQHVHYLTGEESKMNGVHEEESRRRLVKYKLYNIFVKVEGSQPVAVEVKSDGTAGDLRRKAKDAKLDVDEKALLFQGRIIDNATPLADAGIGAEAQVVFVPVPIVVQNIPKCFPEFELPTARTIVMYWSRNEAVYARYKDGPPDEKQVSSARGRNMIPQFDAGKAWFKGYPLNYEVGNETHLQLEITKKKG